MVAVIKSGEVRAPAVAQRKPPGLRSDRSFQRDRYVADRDRAFMRELSYEERRPLTRWKGLVVQMQPRVDFVNARERHNIRQLSTIPDLKYVKSLPLDEATIVAVWLNPNDGKIAQVTEQAFVEIGEEIPVVLEVERQPAGIAIKDVYVGALVLEAAQFAKEWELRLGMVIPITTELPGSVTLLTPLATSMMASTALAMGGVVRL